MFSTFTTGSPKAGQTRSAPKRRSQVNRACDSCRLNRVKCDNNRPCRNCELDNHQCSNDGQNEFRSVAAATKEVERLREQNRELERRLKDAPLNQFISPALTPGASQTSGDDNSEYGDGKAKQWASGLILTNEQQHQTRLHGPSSLSYFLRRLFTFIGESLHHPHWDTSSFSNLMTISTPGETSTMEGLDSFGVLQRAQQDHFLDLFWQGYHCIYPIVDEADFREHYESLWTDSPLGATRRSSPLVDIVMALCIQFGALFIPQSGNQCSGSGGEAASSLDRAYYQRCHAQLTNAREIPDLIMIQCYTLSFIYLRNASRIGTAQIVLAGAIRMAYTLGLNQEPPEYLPGRQKELRRRIWWTLYICDTQICMDQGQPWLTSRSLSLCRLPDDSSEVAQSIGANFISPSPNVTWLSFQKQAIQLVNITRAIQTAFYENYGKMISTIDAPDFYNDGKIRERCANFLAECMKNLRSWVTQVPQEYKTQRKSKGEAFSTDRSTLDLDHTTPLWFQRQRLLLELQYHNLAMIIYRPFICFSPTPATSTPLSDNSAISCLSHAIAITNIMHQVLTETDVLNGWYEALQWQQNAMFVLGGFTCAYPVCPPTPAARKALGAAIKVLATHGNILATAQYAAELARTLSQHIEASINRFRASLNGIEPPPLTDLQESSIQTTIPETASLNKNHLPTSSAVNMIDETFADFDPLRPSTAGTDAESFSWMSNDIISMGNDMWSGSLSNMNFSTADIISPTADLITPIGFPNNFDA